MANQAKKGRATFDDFALVAARGEAVELIDGEVVHKAGPTGEHGQAQSNVNIVLGGFARKTGGPRGPGGWWLMSEVEVLYARTSEVFRHDVLGFRRDVHAEVPKGFPLRARPDWVCEILSPSTARYDVVKKSRTLHAHAVPHYWLLNPEHSTLTVMRYAETGYLQVLTATVGEKVRAEPFEAVEIDVSELFGEEEAP